MSDANPSLSRREMIEQTTAAVVLATPLASLVAAAARPAPPIAPRFLTPSEYALLDELTEMIIPTDEQSPGARAAGVAAYLDARLAESPEPEWQAQWRSGLQSVDALSRDMNGKAFLSAGREQRVSVLARMAAHETNPQAPAEKFFVELKHWTLLGYYTSKVGIHQDQQYKGNVYQPGDYAGYDPT